MNKSYKKIRLFFWGIIALSSYVISIGDLFFNHEIFKSLSGIFLLFLSFHFFYIEIYNFHKKYLIGILSILTIIVGFLIHHNPLTMQIANIAFHGMILALAIVLDGQIKQKINFNGIGYFLAGGYIFSLLLSLTFSSIIVISFSKFPISCKELNNQSDKIISVVTKPFKALKEKSQQITNKTQGFFSTTLKEIGENIKNISIKSESNGNKIADKILDLKENIINKSLQDNEKLNNTVCDFTLKMINSKLSSQTIQYSAIVLIVFLIYPFFRLFIWIMSFVALLIFELLYLAKIYEKESKIKEIKRIG